MNISQQFVRLLQTKIVFRPLVTKFNKLSCHASVGLLFKKKLLTNVYLSNADIFQLLVMGWSYLWSPISLLYPLKWTFIAVPNFNHLKSFSTKLNYKQNQDMNFD